MSILETDTGFEAGLALYHLGLGHFLQIEDIARPFAEVFGDKHDLEMVYGINVREYHLEDFPRKFLDRRRHAIRVSVVSGLSESGLRMSRLAESGLCVCGLAEAGLV